MTGAAAARLAEDAADERALREMRGRLADGADGLRLYVGAHGERAMTSDDRRDEPWVALHCAVADASARGRAELAYALRASLVGRPARLLGAPYFGAGAKIVGMRLTASPYRWMARPTEAPSAAAAWCLDGEIDFPRLGDGRPPPDIWARSREEIALAIARCLTNADDGSPGVACVEHPGRAVHQQCERCFGDAEDDEARRATTRYCAEHALCRRGHALSPLRIVATGIPMHLLAELQRASEEARVPA